MVLVRRKGVVLGGGGGAGEKKRGVGGWCIFCDFRWERFGFVVEWWNFVGLKIVAFVGVLSVSRLCGCCCWG